MRQVIGIGVQVVSEGCKEAEFLGLFIIPECGQLAVHIEHLQGLHKGCGPGAGMAVDQSPEFTLMAGFQGDYQPPLPPGNGFVLGPAGPQGLGVQLIQPPPDLLFQLENGPAQPLQLPAGG